MITLTLPELIESSPSPSSHTTEIQAKIAATVTFGVPTYRFDIVTSTQDIARDWVYRGAKPGTVVTARGMTAGRGRHGRHWYTEPGANLNLTAIGPALPVSSLWQLSLLCGMAVADTITELLPALKPSLRFPNDVLLRGKKVAGVLIETLPGAEKTRIPLIGIGMNLLAFPLPPEVAERAISLEEATGQCLGTSLVEPVLTQQLSRHWQRWQQNGLEELLLTYHAYHDRDARRLFVVNGVPVPARVPRIYPSSVVVIETDHGEQRAFPIHQILFGDE